MLELDSEEVRKLPWLNAEEIADLVWSYRCLKSEVNAINYKIDNLDTKADSVYSKIKLLTEGTTERDESWSKFRNYVKEIDRLELIKNKRLEKLYGIRKLIARMSEPIFRWRIPR